MGFCKFSQGYLTNSKVLVDVGFINNFLPKAPDLCVKAYFLGLVACSTESENNTIEYFSDTLKVCADDVISLFKYWEDLGVVQVLSTNPIEIRYLPIAENAIKPKKFKVDKYTDFNIQVQELFKTRMILPNEFAEFYNLIENQHIMQDAMLAIIRYCIDYKGFNLSPNYCVAVAKDWAKDNIRTLSQVEDKIKELGIVDDNMTLVLSALNSKRKVQLEDKELLNKWTRLMGFDLNVIIYVAKNIRTKKVHTDISNLDEKLSRYYEMKKMSIQEIEDYENEKDNMYQIAMTVNKELGLYYDDMTKEIDTYVVAWQNMGFEQNTLKLIADNCFKSSIKTLEGFNAIIVKLFKLGVVSTSSYLKYLQDAFALDQKIKMVLSALDLDRNVNNLDRNFYKIWTNDWGFTDEVIIYACSLSKNKPNAINYLNKILSNWNIAGTKKLEQVKNSQPMEQTSSEFLHNNYTQAQISSLISNLDEVEV